MTDDLEQHDSDPDEDAPEPKSDRIVEPPLPDTDPVPPEKEND